MAGPVINLTLTRDEHTDVIRAWFRLSQEMGSVARARRQLFAIMRAGIQRPDVVYSLHMRDASKPSESKGAESGSRTRAKRIPEKYMLRVRVDLRLFNDVWSEWIATPRRERTSRFADYIRAGLLLTPAEFQQAQVRAALGPAARPTASEHAPVAAPAEPSKQSHTDENFVLAGEGQTAPADFIENYLSGLGGSR